MASGPQPARVLHPALREHVQPVPPPHQVGRHAHDGLRGAAPAIDGQHLAVQEELPAEDIETMRALEYAGIASGFVAFGLDSRR